MFEKVRETWFVVKCESEKDKGQREKARSLPFLLHLDKSMENKWLLRKLSRIPHCVGW